MIHTVLLYANLSFEEKKIIEKRFKKSIEEVMKEINSDREVIIFSGKNREFHYQINIFADVTKILNRGNVYEKDYDEVKKRIDNEVEYLVGYSLDLILIRVDYRFDKYISSKAERLILIHLYKKMINKHGFKLKKSKNKYKTSVRYDSKSMQIIIYDKEEERKDKNKKCEDYEKCVLRFEVKLLNKHLNYNKRKYNIEKDLKFYFSESLQRKYMLSNIQKIVYKGDYYNIREADKIINKSNMKERDKKFIREFLIDVSENGITGAKEISIESDKQKYTPYKFKKAVSILEELNINPILIPKSREYFHNERHSYIKNPFNL